LRGAGGEGVGCRIKFFMHIDMGKKNPCCAEIIRAGILAQRPGAADAATKGPILKLKISH
jgi:hypothetical protein